MSARRIVALGHSHLVALLGGYEQLAGGSGLDVRFFQLWSPDYEPLAVWVGDGSVYKDNLVDDVLGAVTTMPAEAVVVTLLGAEHYIWAMQGQARPFDLVLPFAPELARVAGAEGVPYGMFRQFAQESLRSYLGFAAFLARRLDVPLIQLLPPPPVCDSGRLLTHSPQVFKDMIADTGAPGATIRHKLWLVWRDVARRIAGDARVILLDPPAAAVDEAGLLRPDYFHTDAVHANADYGALVWRQVEALLNARETADVDASV